MRQQHHGAQGADSLAEVRRRFRELRQLCLNLVTLTPLRRVPIGHPKPNRRGTQCACGSRPQGRWLLLCWPTSPRLSAPAMSDTSRSASARRLPPLRAEEPSAPAAKRKSAGRVQVVTSRRAKHMRLAKRTRAPAFATRGGMTLTSAESRMTTVNPEVGARAPLPRLHRSDADRAERLRGAAQAAPCRAQSRAAGRAPQDAAPVVAEAPAQPPAPAPVAAAKQDRIVPQPVAPHAAAPQPTMELASAESKRVTLPDPAPAKPAPRRGGQRYARAGSFLQRGCAAA